MKRLPPIMALLAGLAVGIGSTAWLLRRPDPIATPAATSATSQKDVLYWYDPMVPNQRFDRPGQSPFMDMPLVPKYADGASEDIGTVRIEPQLVQNLGVRTALATRSTMAAPVRVTGTVAFDERGVALVQARVAGIVEHLAVRAPQTIVRAGQPLLTVIAPEWTAAQAEYLSLRSAHSSGLGALRDAARQRLVLLGMNEDQIRAVERNGRVDDRIVIAAPRDGVVSELLVRDGAGVMPGAPLMRINALDTVWINAAIPEAQIGRVAPGSRVAVTLPAFPGETIAGTVEALLPELDAATRTQTARISVPNPSQRLVPGMFAQVVVSGHGESSAIRVPSEAVIATGTRHVVILDLGGGRFRAQEVRVGDDVEDRTTVLDGVAEGDRVVLSGQFLIDSEASFAGALARLDPLPAAGAGEAAAHVFSASGTIERIDGDTWSIATDPIPALEMGAMTMPFVRPPPAQANGIVVGQRVRFTFVRDDAGGFEITTIAPAAAGDTP